MREEIVEILCQYYEHCTWREQSSCFAPGGKWGICQPVKDADAILLRARTKIKAIDNPYAGRGRAAQSLAFEDCRREIVDLFSGGE